MIVSEDYNELCAFLSHGEGLGVKMMSVHLSCCFHSIAALFLEK